MMKNTAAEERFKPVRGGGGGAADFNAQRRVGWKGQVPNMSAR